MGDAEHKELEDYVYSCFSEDLSDGEFISDWCLVVGTKSVNGGGQTLFASNGAPKWAAEGMLNRGIKLLDSVQED